MKMRQLGIIMLVLGGVLLFVGDSLSGIGDAVDNALSSKLFAGGLAVGGALLFLGSTKRISAL